MKIQNLDLTLLMNAEQNIPTIVPEKYLRSIVRKLSKVRRGQKI